MIDVAHIVLIPGPRLGELGLRCTCGERASRFKRCGPCRALVSRCASHADKGCACTRVA